jgi:hypothetical protein
VIVLTQRVTFETAIAELIEIPNISGDFKHPFLTVAKFILADDKPNQNKQGIKAENFDEVIRSAVDMPVKMNLTKRGGLQNHLGSIPIGHIKQVDKQVTSDNTNQLIATAVLYSDEYPEEIDFLKRSYAEGNAPGISYEMAYGESETENGNQWLKQLVTLAATFVRTPAYGSRTALLALASAGNISLQDLAKELIALAKAEGEGIITGSVDDPKGGNSVTEQEIKELQDKLARTEAEVQTVKTEAATKDQTISDLQAQLTDKDTTIKTLTDENAAMKKATLIDSRVRTLSEAGITLEADAEKAAKKKEFWASLSDDDFAEYVSDLVTAKKASQAPNKVALASLSAPAIPKPEPGKELTPSTLLDTMKSLGRN